MTDLKTIYATHPVRPEIKAWVLANGGRIIDARFAPEGERIMDGQTGHPIGEDAGEAAEKDAVAAKLDADKAAKPAKGAKPVEE
ncbi:hypothetical protein [Paracoccus sp. (in: a-proteobacteria)]|uniref:hypothetical protein n=1 Tax=Paracoccus sp. TaxID=267 RepID=UPI0028A8654F|nr:hypothetical protein [Paracoccus sp. (in: a-proteobacteria)]